MKRIARVIRAIKNYFFPPVVTVGDIEQILFNKGFIETTGAQSGSIAFRSFYNYPWRVTLILTIDKVDAVSLDRPVYSFTTAEQKIKNVYRYFNSNLHVYNYLKETLNHVGLRYSKFEAFYNQEVQ